MRSILLKGAIIGKIVKANHLEDYRIWKQLPRRR